MKKKVIASILMVTLLVSSCGLFPGDADVEDNDTEESQEKDDEEDEEDEEEEDKDDSGDSDQDDTAAVAPINLFYEGEEIYYNPDLVPSVEPYTVAPDLSNVYYHPEFSYWFDNSDSDNQALVDGLAKNGFAITQMGYDEFFDIYEGNRYVMFPSFVTVDSLMHTYHLYFAYLLNHLEKDQLAGKVENITDKMLDASVEQYRDLMGTEWEEAAARNVTFFYVGALLADSGAQLPITDSNISTAATEEYSKIMAAAGIEDCLLTGLMEDYTQYKPRGYYEGDETLEQYFRTMMWYGRIPFALENEDSVKSAVLMSAAVAQDPQDYDDVYSVTSFFAGASDDPGYNQFIGIIQDAYGSVPATDAISSDTASFDKVLEGVKNLELPQINSVPVMDGEDPVIPSFRFMGQRFTIDAAIMQKLVYSYVEENSNGDYRYLPDTLDVAAALGSEEAYKILDEQGDTDYKNYTDNLQIVSDHFNNADAELWNASLYSGWLNTLRPLLVEKGEGYPSFMQSEEWTKKDLETFSGSYAELKHDTILYSKQIMAEMGDGEIEEKDDRGYVEPEPVVYSRFVSLANSTRDGLKNRGMLTEAQEEDLNLLSQMAMTLLTISEKELTNEERTEEEYEFIRTYGGSLEHFWYEVNSEANENLVYSNEAPCPVVADIATNPNGEVLEVGSGEAGVMYVVFPIDGELRVGRGSVYSFYQFTVPLSDRMTDEDFRNDLVGGYIDEDTWSWVEVEGVATQPEWTQSYRVDAY